MCDMCATPPGVRYRPPRWQVRVDTRAWSSAVVDMAEGGDTMEKIAADEMARIRELPDVLRAMSNKTKAQAREDAMLKQMDAEMATRREAVTKRLRIALQREAQVAKEERPVKKVRKHHRMEIEITQHLSRTTMVTRCLADPATSPCLGARFAVMSRRRSGTIWLPLTRWWSRQLVTQSH